jgi:hypothetical protein
LSAARFFECRFDISMRLRSLAWVDVFAIAIFLLPLLRE